MPKTTERSILILYVKSYSLIYNNNSHSFHAILRISARGITSIYIWISHYQVFCCARDISIYDTRTHNNNARRIEVFVLNIYIACAHFRFYYALQVIIFTQI